MSGRSATSRLTPTPSAPDSGTARCHATGPGPPSASPSSAGGSTPANLRRSRARGKVPTPGRKSGTAALRCDGRAEVLVLGLVRARQRDRFPGLGVDDLMARVLDHAADAATLHDVD